MRGGWLAVAFAVAVALVRPPGVLLNGDEYFYAGQATTIAHGRLVPVDGDGLGVPLQLPANAVKYPPGWPVLLAAGRVFSVRAMWAVALLAHLVGGLAIARMLVRRGLPSWGNAVWLFHPSAWLYARTLMSDAPAAAGLLVAMDAWENRDRYLAAAALAIAPAMRIANMLLLAGFALAVTPEIRRRKWDAAVATGGVLLGFGAYLAANYAATGQWISSPYASANTGLIGSRMLLGNAILYACGLALLPPFPLVWMILDRRGLGRWAIAALPLALFLLLYGYHDVGGSVVETLVGGQRLLLPAIAVLIAATVGSWGAQPWVLRGWSSSQPLLL